MNARLILRRRFVISHSGFAEMVAWHVPIPLKGSVHSFKYRFAYDVNERCVLRYDNEAGKGDHRHVGEEELPYVFESLDRLISDFLAEVEGYEQ